MRSFLLLISAFALLVECCFAAEPSTRGKSKTWPATCKPGELLSEDLVGTWRIEPSTFCVDKDLARAGGSQLWTNYSALEFTLRKDGSVVATNVPANLFIEGWPATATKFGYWNMYTNSSEGVIANRTVYTNSDLNLGLALFKTSVIDWTTNSGIWGTGLCWYQKSPTAPRVPAVTLDGPRDKSGFVHWCVMFTKQNQEFSAESGPRTGSE